jgi:4-diphosphocytidyl-2-C-methyl-D-erythritol kinase
VSCALGKFPRPDGLAVKLEKRLPIAAGLGGGSADAGAVFRLVARRYGPCDDWHERAATLGADVPACVASIACVGRGTGTQLHRAINDLEGWPVLLVNPRVAMATGPVFAGWDGQDRGPLAKSELVSKIAREGRNDLEASAIELCPVVADVLNELHDDAPWIARMSGSGATCFAIYQNKDARDAAATRIASKHPDWWQMASKLR